MANPRSASSSKSSAEAEHPSNTALVVRRLARGHFPIWITSFNQVVFDPTDPFQRGFVVGRRERCYKATRRYLSLDAAPVYPLSSFDVAQLSPSEPRRHAAPGARRLFRIYSVSARHPSARARAENAAIRAFAERRG